MVPHDTLTAGDARLNTSCHCFQSSDDEARWSYSSLKARGINVSLAPVFAFHP